MERLHLQNRSLPSPHMHQTNFPHCDTAPHDVPSPSGNRPADHTSSAAHNPDTGKPPSYLSAVQSKHLRRLLSLQACLLCTRPVSSEAPPEAAYNSLYPICPTQFLPAMCPDTPSQCQYRPDHTPSQLQVHSQQTALFPLLFLQPGKSRLLPSRLQTIQSSAPDCFSEWIPFHPVHPLHPIQLLRPGSDQMQY